MSIVTVLLHVCIEVLVKSLGSLGPYVVGLVDVIANKFGYVILKNLME